MLEPGSVVRSRAGRDAGKLMVVTCVNEKGVLLCDGKERPVERPKLKSPRHVADTGMRLDLKLTASNRALKKALSALDATGSLTERRSSGGIVYV